MTQKKAKKKNPAAVALATISREKRMKTMTAAQRSAQGIRAVMSRRDRQKGPWFGLVVLPADYQWKGTRHAAKVLDEVMADSGKVVFWSQNRAEVTARAQEKDLRKRDTIIIEQGWDPNAFRLICEYNPDPVRKRAGLQTALGGDRS